MTAKLPAKEKRDRQDKVADLFFKGYNPKRIVDRLGFTEKEVYHYLNLIRSKLTPQTQKTIEHRRNKILNKIALVQQRAWEIEHDAPQNTIKLAALRVVISSHELESKVEGVTQEKVEISSADHQADTLNKKILELEKKAKEPSDNGHDEVEKLPEFLEGKSG